MGFDRVFSKVKNRIETPEKGMGWDVGLPGWAQAMQAKSRPTDTPTIRYNGYKMKLSGFFTIEKFRD